MQSDGGNWPNQSSQERLPSLIEICNQFKIAWLDLEWEERSFYAKTKAQLSTTKILVSHHNFKNSYSEIELQNLAEEVNPWNFEGFKMALYFQKQSHEVDLYRTLRHQVFKNLLAAFSMGPSGKRSRVLSPLLGAPWTYGYFGTTPSAPGQWSVSELIEKFNADQNLDGVLQIFLKGDSK